MARTGYVLAATDFSQASMDALARARDLAADMDADLHVVHVVPDPALVPWSVEAGPALVELGPHWRAEAERELQRVCEAAGLPAERTKMSVAMGDAAAEIVQCAEDVGADVVVVGTHGRGRFERLMLGSVADKVIRKSHRPVLVVPPAEAS